MRRRELGATRAHPIPRNNGLALSISSCCSKKATPPQNHTPLVEIRMRKRKGTCKFYIQTLHEKKPYAMAIFRYQSAAEWAGDRHVIEEVSLESD